MDLPESVERHDLVVGPNEQAPSPSTPAASPSPSGPSDALAEEGVPGSEAVEDLLGGGGDPPLEGTQKPLEGGLDIGDPEAERSGGVTQFVGQVLEAYGDIDSRPNHRPALLGPALDEDPGHLAPRDEHVVEPRSRAGDPPVSSTTSDTATPAARGSNRGGSRTITEQRIDRPAGALHVRPWRPRPADCSLAVTIVP